jgi:hypothetical protein
MNQELIIIEDGERIDYQTNKEQTNAESLKKSQFSLETNNCQTRMASEINNNHSLKLNIKRFRTNKEKTQKKSEKKRIKLSNKKNSSLKKNKTLTAPSSANLEINSRKFSEVPKYSDISSNSTFDNLHKDLNGNKFSVLEANSDQIKTSFEQFTKTNTNNIIKNFAIKKIKLSLEKLKANKEKDSQGENLNLFEILKENKIDPQKEDIVMLNISHNKDKQLLNKQEFFTPNKVNFYEEHCKRFYKNEPFIINDNKNHDNLNVVNQKKPIEDSPFKTISVPNGIPSPSDCLYLYSHLSKALILVGFFGIVTIYLKDDMINTSMSETVNYLMEHWKTNLVIIVSLAIMIYYFNNRLDNSEQLYKESVARMILENMKIVLENEKSNNPQIFITENDIVVYFSYHLKLTEEFILKSIIPLISIYVEKEKSLVEEKEIVNEQESLKWRLTSSK